MWRVNSRIVSTVRFFCFLAKLFFDIVLLRVPFSFDAVFGPECPQQQVFDAVSSSIMQDFFKGFNATVFAYGQTGSGKTWTMMGERNDPTNEGLIPRLVAMVFQHIAEILESGDDARGNLYFHVELGYIEIYMERIQDLLDMSRSNLQIREARGRGAPFCPLVVSC